MSGILEGIKVLDVGTFVFGPAAATVMSDFGAEVIKIENPEMGDPYRYLSQMPPLPACEDNYCWLLDARNKKSVALNLKDDAARNILLKLVENADIFLTNYPPAVVESLSLTYDDIRSTKENIIYAHATGYGEAGPERDRPGYDATAWWARSGLMDAVRASGADPSLSAAAMGDRPGAMSLFGGIMLALYERQRTGKGTKVSTSLMANGAWAHGCLIQSALCGGGPFEQVDRRAPTNAMVNIYTTKDGRWFILALVQEDRDWPRLAEAVGRSDLANDPRFNEKAERRAHSKELAVILDEAFTSKNFDEWQHLLDKHHITFGVVSQLEDIPNDPQMAANDIFIEVDDPRVDKFKTIDSPIWLEGHEKTAPRLAPELGEHTEEILAKLGYGDETIKSLRESGAIR